MPIIYQTSILFLLTGLYQGNFLHSFLYQILFFFSVAVSLACDPSTLPRGVQISQNGPVLKLTCDPGLQPLEMAYVDSPTDLPFPVPSKRKFARYVCMNGASYQRINAKGIERSLFFCTDDQSNLCESLETSAEHGQLQVRGAVAIWRSVPNRQRSVLYCAHGVWHRLGGGSLPHGVTIKSQRKEKVLITPDTTASTSTDASNDEITTATTTTTTISVATSFPPSYATTTITPMKSKAERLHLSNRLLSPPASPRTQVLCTTPESHPHLPKTSSLDPELTKNLHIPTANIIVFAGSVSLALHDHFHKCTRIAFYCMVVIGLGALIAGLLVLMLVCRKSRLFTSVVEAQERLKTIPTSV